MAQIHDTVLYEELSMNAHPALQTQLYDGWILRFSDGYTNRANSVNPLYHAVLPLADKIDHCETVYRSQNLPVVYKLTHACGDVLDKLLQTRGYRIVSPTNIMTKDITDFHHNSTDFYVSSLVEDYWIGSYFALNGLTDSNKKATATLMLRNIQNAVLCGTVKNNGQTIACGLCVIERGYAGLFDIVVDSAYRGQGYGYEICRSLLNEAKKYGAKRAYLQVVQSNFNAIGLYNKLGFSNLYEYWYRVNDTLA